MLKLRSFLIPLLAASAALASLTEPNSATYPLRIWESTPGVYFNDSFVIGNGRLGASLLGIPASDTIFVNDDTFWSGSWHDRVNPDALANIPVMRDLILNNQNPEASTLATYAYAGNPISTRFYDFFGTIYLNMNHTDTNITNYERWLDIHNATSGVYYTVDNNVTYQREMIASNPADVIAIRISCDTPGALGFGVSVQRGNLENRWSEYNKHIDSQTVIMGGQGAGYNPLEWAEGVRVVAEGGTTQALGEFVKVTGSDSATIYFSGWTSVRQSDPYNAVIQSLDAIAGKMYEEIKQEHIVDYCGYFGRVDLSLGESTGQQKAMNTSDRFAALQNAFDPELAALHYQFGRYLLISSSRQGTLPPNLQGIWSMDVEPKWGSKYTLNINLEMNYWPSLVTGLSDLTEPLFTLIESMRDRGGAVAAQMYGVGGSVTHHNTDSWGDSAPQDDYAPGTFWPSGLAWIVTHIWEHYLYTGDENMLQQNYPAIHDAVLFYLNFMSDYGEYKVNNPSLSPENNFYMPNSTTKVAITAGPTLDNSLAWTLFGIIEECHQKWGLGEDDFVAKARDYRSKLVPLRKNYFGGVAEWIEDYEETDPGHTVFSPVWGLFPGAQITPSNQEFWDAAEVSVQHRLANGGGSTGWSRAWAIALCARSFNTTCVGESMTTLLTNYTYTTSMLNTGPPADWQIDGNFGGPAGVSEALLQSHEYVTGDNSSGLQSAYVGDLSVTKVPLIRILPALPTTWASNGGGYVTGLQARGGFTVDIYWDNNAKLQNATITSANGGNAWVTVGQSVIEGSGNGTMISVNGNNGTIVPLSTTKGSSYVVTPS